jgi:RNA-directed DNA polymerase
VKELFRKGRGRNVERLIREELTPLLRGWINYFKLAEVKQFAEELDSWVRRRLRLILWRQWKRPWTRMKRMMDAKSGQTDPRHSEQTDPYLFGAN